MPVKLLAVAVLAFVGWTAGGDAARIQTERYQRLCGVLTLVRRVNDGIRFTRTELGEIFSSFHDDALEKCGFLGCLASALPLDVSWKNAVECLDAGGEAKTILLDFGEDLGKTDLATQTEQTELCISRLSRLCDEAGNDLAKKVRSFRVLGLLASLAAAIVLY